MTKVVKFFFIESSFQSFSLSTKLLILQFSLLNGTELYVQGAGNMFCSEPAGFNLLALFFS